jgi:hypothetical protein
VVLGLFGVFVDQGGAQAATQRGVLVGLGVRRGVHKEGDFELEDMAPMGSRKGMRAIGEGADGPFAEAFG